MIKNIIFDLGNVLISFKPDLFLLKFTKDRTRINKFMSNIIQTDIWLQLDRGTLSLEQAQEKFLSVYPEDADLVILFFNRWKEILTPIRENVKLLEELKSNGYKLYVLSNFINEAYEYVNECYNFFSYFDGIVISSKINLIKPELEIYQYLLQKYNLNPEESVFIDDTVECTLQASRLNIKTILYLPDTNLRAELKKLNLKV